MPGCHQTLLLDLSSLITTGSSQTIWGIGYQTQVSFVQRKIHYMLHYCSGPVDYKLVVG